MGGTRAGPAQAGGAGPGGAGPGGAGPGDVGTGDDGGGAEAGPPALVDHHCHSVLDAELGDEELAGLLTESDRPPAPGTSPLDSALGLALRRWCPPVLGLPAHAPAADYLARRRELGAPEATRRLLAAAGLDTCLVDTGLTAAAGARCCPCRSSPP